MGDEFRDFSDRAAEEAPEDESDSSEGVPFREVVEQAEAWAPIDWWKLSQVKRQKVFGELEEFVAALVRSYGLSEQVVPRCWFLHDALVQELLALQQFRQISYAWKAPGTAPNEFHTQFHFTRGRLREWVGQFGCTGVDHFETVVPGWAGADYQAWRSDFARFAGIDVKNVSGEV